MDFIDAFNQAGIFAKLSLLVGFGPLGLAIVYVLRPAERTLAIMRPVSLAAIFAGICGLVAGLIAVLMGVANGPRPVPYRTSISAFQRRWWRRSSTLACWQPPGCSWPSA